jgi:hypothetical protein
MADAGVMGGSRGERVLERMKTTAGVVAALAGAITGLWTVYEKVKTDARQYTTTSYETLAPQMNQMSEALKKLEQDNQELKQALAHGRPRPHPTARPSEPAAPPVPMPGVPATSAPAQGQEQQDPVGELIGRVNQTREAVNAISKVPETFKQVLEGQKKK